MSKIFLVVLGDTKRLSRALSICQIFEFLLSKNVVTDVVNGELQGLGFSRNLWESLATEPPPKGPRVGFIHF